MTTYQQLPSGIFQRDCCSRFCRLLPGKLLIDETANGVNIKSEKISNDSFLWPFSTTKEFNLKKLAQCFQFAVLFNPRSSKAKYIYFQSRSNCRIILDKSKLLLYTWYSLSPPCLQGFQVHAYPYNFAINSSRLTYVTFR